MKNITLSLTVLALACCCVVPVFAQYDSSRLDVGYLHLKRDFTQTITIKGADLEKMPFANLSDALAAWFNGAYTQPATLQYVVDGNPVSDVNAYSVYDIEEVVLVENAAALVNTASLGTVGSGQQELIVIRTKRGKGPGGIRVAAQAGLVKGKEDGETAQAAVYHNYYIGGWRNQGSISYGISGNYLRDVMPDPEPSSGYKAVTPDNLQRWRFNCYFTWRPDSRNQVELTMNYTPQRQKDDQQSTGQPQTYLYTINNPQHVVLPHLSWHSNWGSKWSNHLQASYIHSTAKVGQTSSEVIYPVNTGEEAEYFYNTEAENSTHYWVRDRVGFTATAGAWRIEPSINASYEHVYEQTTNGQIKATAIGSDAIISPQTATSVTEFNGEFLEKESLVEVTPVLDISYKRSLDVQGGMLWDAGHQPGSNGYRVFPFASLSLDILRLANDNSPAGLKIFGSYAQRTVSSPQGYALSDLTNYNNFIYGGSSPVLYSTTYDNGVFVETRLKQPFWVWEAGASYTGWKDRLTIQYTFEQRNLLEQIRFQTLTSPVETYAPWQSTLQHGDIRVKILDAEGFHWMAGVNVTLLHNKPNAIAMNPGNVGESPAFGDNVPDPTSWTGGLVNRVQIKRFTAGLDLLYHFGESVPEPPDTIKVNSVITPNIYIGYNWHLSGTRTLEFFAESWGLIRNSVNDLLDYRPYYTVGGNLSL